MNRNALRALAVAALLGVSACSGGPNPTPGSSAAAPTSPSDLEEIATLLDRGKVDKARKRLEDALEDDPLNPTLLVMRQGIYGNAREDLGPDSFEHEVEAGETWRDLAVRFLGNRYKSYQLARYNGFEQPQGLAVGQVVRIPQTVTRPATARSAPAPAEKAPPRRRETRSVAKAPTPATAAPEAAPEPPPGPSPADRRRAQDARTAGLTALNKGEVGKAVALLRRAAGLDPSNAAIEGDLARARRIAATVRSRR